MSFSLTNESCLLDIIDSFKLRILPLLKLLLLSLDLDNKLKLFDLILLFGLVDGNFILLFFNLLELRITLNLGDSFSLLISL